MHFAAQTHVDNSFGNSFAFTHNNIYGTHVLLESAKNNPKLKRFIHVSTDEVYGETPSDAECGYTEGQILNPTNPYSATKAAAEMLVTAYAHSYKLPVIITRGNNVYGPGQFPEKLIPKFCMRAMRGEKLPVHGEGKAVRSYLYIDDVVEAFDIILHMGKTGETYNIGTKKERSVMEVAEEICKVFGLNKEETIQFVEDRPFNDCRYFIEDAKLAALGWSEKTRWEDGIKKTLAFYRDANCWWKKSLVNEALNN
jgi:UDP-glucose 4,6-dehydratase